MRMVDWIAQMISSGTNTRILKARLKFQGRRRSGFSTSL